MYVFVCEWGKCIGLCIDIIMCVKFVNVFYSWIFVSAGVIPTRNGCKKLISWRYDNTDIPPFSSYLIYC